MLHHSQFHSFIQCHCLQDSYSPCKCNYKLIHTKLSYCAFNQACDLKSIVVRDTILIDGNYHQQHNISLVTLVVLTDLCKENNNCKTTPLNVCGLLLLLWTNLENISRIFNFADLDLPRNCAKIGRGENFPFYGMRPKYGLFQTRPIF